jgi:hypothetical protein
VISFHAIWWVWTHCVTTMLLLVSLYLNRVHQARLMRGVVRRRLGIEKILMLQLSSLGVLIVCPVLWLTGNVMAGDMLFSFYATSRAAWDVIDYITGGDDPGKRLRRWASNKVKKLTITAPPRPVPRPA